MTNPELLAEKDKITGVSTTERKSNREDIPLAEILPGADQGIAVGPGGESTAI